METAISCGCLQMLILHMRPWSIPEGMCSIDIRGINVYSLIELSYGFGQFKN